MPNVHLTKQMLEFAEARIASGAYSNLSEVVREGMRLLMNRHKALPIIWERMEALEEAALDGTLGDP
jgi:putative addiction module CopG family antidote